VRDVNGELEQLIGRIVDERIALALAGRKPSPKVEAYVSAADVQAALGCSRSAAYRHMRAAAGRPVGTRRMLRVTTESWRRYATRTVGR
jgi:hypothetical protein